MNPVSAVIITLNEADNLRKSLPQLSWCDEIIVVDSGSTDNTLDVCKQYHCVVHEKKFNGYGEQKQFGISLARNKWILCTDADEVLTDELVAEMKQEMIQPTAVAYLVPITLVFMGTIFKYGKDSRRYFLRLFNKEFGNFNSNVLHEKIEVTGEKKKMKNIILHFSYRDIDHYFFKFNKFSTLGAKAAFEQGKRKSLLLTILSVPLYFLRYFFIEMNFLNGAGGFYWSMFSAYYHFVKYTKIRELYATEKNSVR